MSAGARRHSPEPKFERNKRHKPAGQLMATVHCSTVDNQGNRVIEHHAIKRFRYRSERACAANICRRPGLDGYRWTCDCTTYGGVQPEIRPSKKDAWEGLICDHLQYIAEGSRPEGTEPNIEHPTLIELTPLGEQALRPWWVTITLFDMESADP